MATPTRSNDTPTPKSDTDRNVGEALSRAKQLSDEDKNNEAEQELTKALSAFGENAELLYELAQIELYKEDYESAVTHFEQAVQLNPEDVVTVRAYIQLIEQLNLYRRALDFISTFPSEVRDRPELRSAVGAIYARAGWYGLALDSYGLRRGLSTSTMRLRLYYWIRCGGPIPPLRKRIRRLDEDARYRWKIWSENLTVFDTLDRPQGFAAELIRSDVDAYLENWATTAVWWTAVETWVALLILFLAVVAQWITIFELSEKTNSVWSGVVDASVSVPIALAVWQLINSVQGTGSSRNRLTRRLAASAVLIACGIFLRDLDSSRWLVVAVAYPLIGGALIAISVAVTIELVGLAFGVRINNIRMRSPREAILDYLIDLLTEVTSLSNKNDLDVRRNMIRMLEYAARALERDLPKVLESGDSQTDNWLAYRAAGAATALRHLKRYIVVSGSDTWEWIATVLRSEIGALASGDWTSLRWTSPPPKETKTKSVWRIAIVVLRTVVVMAIPLAATLALNPILVLAPKTFATAKVISVAWAVLYFLLTIDPTLKSKIETARSVIGTVRESREAAAGPAAQAAADKQRGSLP